MKPAVLLSVLLCFFTISCRKDNGDDDKGEHGEASTGAVGEISDSSLTGLQSFLKANSYSGWTAEAAVHDSSGPHGKVKTFFNDALKASLEQNAETHPVGSISIKELYASDGTTLQGYAVAAKVTAGSGGDTWLWFEGFTPDFDEYYGRGLSTCVGCHASGSDYIRAALP